MSCLTDDVVADWVDGRLPPAQLAALTTHIDGCAACRELVAGAMNAIGPSLSASADAREARTPTLSPGDRVGRYQVLSIVGAGAMGVVYLALDTELQRRVALKLQRPTDQAADQRRLLLLREAQAMARLAHPNTVAVHEVGAHEGQIFIAMEYVEGQTLRAWLAERKRPWSEIVAAFAQAGAGLQAAHQSGLVHRDFKPDNVLVCGDGRVRVTDFGLARSHGAVSPAPQRTELPASALDELITRTGALVGTPAYMAPEQLKGGSADARSDQFAFCVALHEALFGQRPFSGRTAQELAESCARGELQFGSGGSAPERIRRALRRGLSADPERRFPSMQALLAALAQRRNRAALAAAAVTLLAAALVSWLYLRPQLVCGTIDAQVRGAFGPSVREAARASFTHSGNAKAAGVFDQLTQRFDRYLSELSSASVSLCKSRAVRGDPDGVLSLRIACLERRQAEAAALGQVFAAADDLTVDAALSAFGALKSVSSCADTRGLRVQFPLPADAAGRAMLTHLWTELARANAYVLLWQGERGLAIARPAVEAARALGYVPIEARLLFMEGNLLHAAERNEEAIDALVAAASRADFSGDDETAVEAFAIVAHVAGAKLSRYSEGLHYLALADGPAQRLGDPPTLRARLELQHCNIDWLAGHPEEAEPHCRRVLAITPDDVDHEGERVRAEELLANALSDEGRIEAAIEGHRRVVMMRERASIASGALAQSLANLGDDLVTVGRCEEALAMIDRALEQRKVEGYADGFAHDRRAAALRGLGRFAEALTEDRVAQQILGSTRGDQSRWFAYPLYGEGLDLLGLSRPDEAIAPLE
ncbi:MAG: protein kinase, partial [Deltaproteobacteria bacterium]|nr:protein kinase [Deltaproteobacteria bacterium]